MLGSLQTPPLCIESGYVTLAELGRSLTRQGIPVRVAEGGDDIYAIRAPKTDWPHLRAALVADGRLTIWRDGEGWAIALEPANRSAERRALGQYEESVRSQIYAICAPAEQTARSYFALSNERWAELSGGLYEEQMQALNKPVSKGTLSFGWAWAARSNGDFARVSLPTLLTHSGSRLGTIWTASTVEAAPFLVPEGDILQNYYLGESFGSLGAQERTAALRAARFKAKFVWDPLTLTTGFRWGYWTPAFARDLDRTYHGNEVWRITPKSFLSDGDIPLNVPETDWRLAVRGHDPAWDSEAPMPNRPVALSEVALRWAEAQGADLVAYVSSLGDLPLRPKPKLSLAEAVRDADAGKMDRSSVWTMVGAWAGEEGGPWPRVSSLPPARRMTLLRTGDFTVLRTETRFLDGLVPRGLNVSPTWLDDRKGAPTLGELVRKAASLRPSTWPSGYASLALLKWFNPASFYPFAALLSANPALQAAVGGLKEGQSMVRPVHRMPGEARFLAALKEASPFNDDIGILGIDGLFVPEILQDDSVVLNLSVMRQRGIDWFELYIAKGDDPYGKPVWRSALRLPQ